MIGKNKFGACLPTFGGCSDRYCGSGYGGGGRTMDEMLDLAAKVEGLDGLELVGNWHVNDDNVKTVGKMFADKGFEIPMLVPDLWTQAKWGRGSMAAPDPKTRQAAIDEIKKVMDWAAEMGTKYIDVWPGQDGFDYPFEADYISAWQWMRDALGECSEHNDQVRILVEYKQREPRTHLFVDHFGTVLLLLNDLPKVGVLLDYGHARQGGENVAYAASMLARYGKLDYMHINDNCGDWDDDMIVGMIHTPGTLEMFYWLRKLDYQGWLTLDIFPYREYDKVRVAEECRDWVSGMFSVIDRVGMDTMDKVIASGDALEASAMLRNALGMT
jgi:xylose isomerase